MPGEAALLNQQPASEGHGGPVTAAVRPGRIVLLFAAATMVGVGLLCPAALGVILREGPPAIVLLLAAQGMGAYPYSWLIGRRCEPGWQALGAWGLGLGASSLLVLSFGTLGLLQQGLWWTLVAAAAIGGTIRLIRIWRQITVSPSTLSGDADPARWAWLACTPFVILAALACTMPPGTLWPAEGNGYDVLEYHLGAPRDYLDRGRIGYLPHNIYSNFPFNVEMLYLLTMILRGDPLKAAFSAQILNALLGVLAVAAVWLAARPFGRPSGLVAALLAASCPFLAYLCGLAYVENGLLFFTAMALAALMQGDRVAPETTPVTRPIRWLALAGAMAGFACGCKYIALPQVIVPLAAAAAWIGWRRRVGPTRSLAAFALPALLTLSPWLLKNAAATGNPVFPLARSVFPERAGIWDDDGAARWQEGHLPAPEDRSPAGRVGRLWSQILATPYFGPLIALMAAASAVLMLRRPRPHGLAPCWLLAGGTLITWLGFSHLVDRFAVVLIPPAAIVIAVAADRLRGGRSIGRVIIAAAITVNLLLILRIFQNCAVFDLCRVRTGDGLDWFTGGEWPTHQHVPVLNEIARRGERVLMVGDARRFYLERGIDYCVVFNRNPFAEAAADRSPAELLRWLQDQKYSYLYVDWGEMRRLRASRYGFWKGVDESLFERLTAPGLIQERSFTMEEGGRAYSTLYHLTQ